MPRYFYLICYFLFFNVGPGLASKSVKQTNVKQANEKVVLKTDSSAINIRYFDKTALSKYAKQPEFQYNDSPAGPSLWTRFWRWFWNWFLHLFDFLKSNNHSSTFFGALVAILEILFVLAGVAAIVFIILKMIGIDIRHLFVKKSLSDNLPYSELLENIHEIDFDAEIEKAVAQHNYRLAVRMHYLKCLKQLNDAALIQWQPEKTNSVYINELSAPPLQAAFKLLTRQFEYVWYGEFAIDSNIYKNINFMFQKFKNDLA